MNLLPFVMCMLMLLSLITYGRLERYVSEKAVGIVFTDFIAKNQRAALFDSMNEKYDLITSRDNANFERAGTVKAASMLNWSIFFGSDARARDPERYEVYRHLTKRLVDNLYKNHPYFQEIRESRPGFVDELIDSFATLEEGPKIKSVKQLDKLKLSDDRLNEVLYYLLKEEAGEPSLRNLITFSPHKDIRVFLAPEPLLAALFQDAGAADRVIAERKELSRLVRRKNGGLSVKQASDRFKEIIQSLGSPADKFLNTEVSKAH